MSMSQPVAILRGRFARLREVVRTLASYGIAAEIVEPPGADANA